MSLPKKKLDLKTKILDKLKNSTSLISAKDLLDSLENKYNKTSIYRQLEKLFEIRKVRKVETENATLYELNQNPHAHFHCIKCQKFVCVEVEKEFDLDLKKLEKMEIFTFNIDIQGVCELCKT